MGKGNPFGRMPSMPPRPPMVALDRFGKMLQKGQLILLKTELDLVFEVVDVRPVLNPNIGPGGHAIQVTLATQPFPVHINAAQPYKFITVLREPMQPEANGHVPEETSAIEAADQAQPGGSIALTDAPEVPTGPVAVPDPLSDVGRCPACEATGIVGDPCRSCGDATYQAV